MSSRRSSLSIPDRTREEDPGARELDSDSEDHFSDAPSVPPASSRASPIPRTRVEKVSDEPSYGEVPGTEAYRLREGDAEPDEIAYVEDEDSKAEELAVPPSPARPSTPGGKPIPATVVEESVDGEGAKTPDGKKHQSDPLPDLLVKADGTLEGDLSATASPISTAPNSPISTHARRRSSSSHSVQKSVADPNSIASRSAGTTTAGVAAVDVAHKNEDGDGKEEGDGDNDDDDDFGDDFDDFEEGGAGDDDDFGDFDDGFQEPEASSATAPAPQAAAQGLHFPVPDFEGLDAEEVINITEPYLNSIYPPEDDDLQPPPPLSNSLFLTPRSASLWSQLVAPPPLQPPDWIRSRIRRLFLVSLGVPVDLDEILPASKQKKLVLPSLSLRSRDSPRTSTDSRRENGGTATPSGVARLKGSGANASSSSVDSQGKPSKSRKRKGPPPPPDFDLVSTRQLCMTTDEALDGMTDDELRAHIKRLESLEGTAKEVLDYWTKRTDEKIGDREAFEGVIENLVKHARKTRK